MQVSIRIGAGGRWRVFNEIYDPNVVKQQSKVSCAPACGEMLFRDRGIQINQGMIERASFAPISADYFARTLNALDPNKRWEGGFISLPGASDKQILDRLNKSGSWAAMMWERGASMGHLVIIDGFDNDGRLAVRDPWDGTSYKMQLKDFLEVWSGVAVYASD